MTEGETGPIAPRSTILFALCAALVLLLVGICVALAVGRAVPDELWVVASALLGALVGTLIPSPARSSAAGYVTYAVHSITTAANSAAREAARAIIADSNQTDEAKGAAQQAVAEVEDISSKAASETYPAARAGDAMRRTAGVYARRPRSGTYGFVAGRIYDAAAEGAESATSDLLESANPRILASEQRRLVGWELLAALGIVVLIALAVLIGAGTIRAAGCRDTVDIPGKCGDSSVLEIGTTLLALAGGVVGLVVGVFASPDAEPRTSGA